MEHTAKVHESQLKEYKKNKIWKSKIISEVINGSFTIITYNID